MKGERAITYLREIENLGEFKFIFKKNDKPFEDTKDKKYFLEAFYNPKDYGKVDFLVGFWIDDIDKEIESLEEDLDYYIDGARVSCICNLHDDIDGVYTGILMNYFDYDEYEIEELKNEETLEG